MQPHEKFLRNHRKPLVAHQVARLENQEDDVSALTFSQDGTVLIATGWPSRFWHEDQEGHWHLTRTLPGAFVAMQSDQRYLMVLKENTTLNRIELQDTTGACLQTLSFFDKKTRYYGYFHDQKKFLTYDQEGWLSIWDGKTFQLETRCYYLPDTDRPYENIALMRLTPDEHFLFFYYYGLIYRCRFDSDLLRVVPEGYVFQRPTFRFDAEDCQISPLGTVIAVAHSSESAIELYEISSLQKLASFPVESPFRLAFSPDGRLLACVDDESKVFIWDVSTGQLMCTFLSHPGPSMEQMPSVVCIAWSPRGDIIAIAGSLYEIKDFSIHLWKIEY
ncbi:WD40 repeat domain-containing protein [Tengunoibacter tsumagoiensis]|uniref:Anaphase-promoting complex subunit 4 WD40 domain-containing protein n=1 Tax=Tengunoibacter tsumagoiensis TaxID=2014871 RepID=A0A401ZYS9_9CHLR|nr:WD40 repeat domain-containing protein [Tengunoibacter tsumagoiensis]GCE12009.1 hypothetical protein KTT_18680 [Tengunoibacter tsumagoiensis]